MTFEARIKANLAELQWQILALQQALETAQEEIAALKPIPTEE